MVSSCRSFPYDSRGVFHPGGRLQSFNSSNFLLTLSSRQPRPLADTRWENHQYFRPVHHRLCHLPRLPAKTPPSLRSVQQQECLQDQQVVEGTR